MLYSWVSGWTSGAKVLFPHPMDFVNCDGACGWAIWRKAGAGKVCARSDFPCEMLRPRQWVTGQWVSERTRGFRAGSPESLPPGFLSVLSANRTGPVSSPPPHTRTHQTVLAASKCVMPQETFARCSFRKLYKTLVLKEWCQKKCLECRCRTVNCFVLRKPVTFG